MRRQLVVAFLPLAILSACTSPSLYDPNDPSALPPRLRVLAATPDSIHIEISAMLPNRPVWGFGTSCTLGVQRQVDGVWVDAGALLVEEGEELLCPLPLIVMDPRKPMRFWSPIRASLATETVPIRVAMGVSVPLAKGTDIPQSSTVVSEPFVIP
jgi:hypothetical protein